MGLCENAGVCPDPVHADGLGREMRRILHSGQAEISMGMGSDAVPTSLCAQSTEIRVSKASRLGIAIVVVGGYLIF